MVKTSVPLQKSKNPSVYMALIALAVAFALPFVFVKSFPQKQSRQNYRLSPAETFSALVDASVSASHEQIKLALKTSTALQGMASLNGLGSHPTVKEGITTKPSSPENAWKIVVTQPRDSLAKVFQRMGLSAKTLHAIANTKPNSPVWKNLKPKQELKFFIKDNILQKLIIPVDDMQYLVTSLKGNKYQTETRFNKTDVRNRYLTSTVQGSLSITAKKKNIPYTLIQQMADIFTWDINFSRDVRSGDQFTIIYKAYYIKDKLVKTGEIQAVSFKNRGKVFQALRYTTRDGSTDYYTPKGVSLKKAFSRYPLRFSHISSPYSLSRKHPILHYARPHKGVDLAAPIGTAIRAVGNGRIDTIGRQNGYGNMIKINHSKTYSSIYGHMLKFQKGLSKGDFVKQGEIIGYVGQTGLASGPHCHYELHVNHVPKNPTTIELPRAEPLSRREMLAFMAKSGPLLAQLKLLEKTQIG